MVARLRHPPKRLASDAGDAIGNAHAGETTAAPKRSVSDADDSVCMVTFVKLLPENASFPILITLLGMDQLFAELGRVGWLVERKPSEWPKTTHVDPNLPVFKNLIKRSPTTGPNQVWVADITYIRTREAFMYLALITDRWSRKIVGYHLGETLETEQVLKALAMALKGLPGAARPIHHSDRGC